MIKQLPQDWFRMCQRRQRRQIPYLDPVIWKNGSFRNATPFGRYG